MKNLNIYYFDNNVGDFDEFNPRFVMEQPYCKKIIEYLSQYKAYTVSMLALERKFKATKSEIEKAIKLLNNISAIKIKEDKLCLNLVFFNSTDIKKIKRIIINNLKNDLAFYENYFSTCEKYMSTLYPTINPKDTLYHLVCGKIFDGSLFDYLEKENLLKQSFKQKNNRDYMIIAYQNSPTCNNLNKKLYCSFNHARYNQNSLTSFGNAYGERYDYFRYFQLRDKNKLYGKFIDLHKELKDYDKETIMKNLLECLQNIIQNNNIDKNNKFYEILINTNYITKDYKINVPIFDEYKQKLELIHEKIINDLGQVIITNLNKIKKAVLSSNILCVNHGVMEEQLLNELWHIYFGLLNNFLVDKKIVAKPQQFKGEGKYLKCIYYFDKISSK